MKSYNWLQLKGEAAWLMANEPMKTGVFGATMGAQTSVPGDRVNGPGDVADTDEVPT